MPIEPRLQLPWLRVHKVNNKRVVVHELTRGRMREEFVDTSISLFLFLCIAFYSL